MKLHLVLKSKWYDMIESGEKPEEYRAFNAYWKKRLGTHKESEAFKKDGVACVLYGVILPDGSLAKYWFKNFESVVFHKGYTNVTMEWKIKNALLGISLQEWGGNDEPAFIIELAERVK